MKTKSTTMQLITWLITTQCQTTVPLRGLLSLLLAPSTLMWTSALLHRPTKPARCSASMRENVPDININIPRTLKVATTIAITAGTMCLWKREYAYALMLHMTGVAWHTWLSVMSAVLRPAGMSCVASSVLQVQSMVSANIARANVKQNRLQDDLPMFTSRPATCTR